MARPREFDETRALDQALCVFWKLGFEGAAISDLTEATGLQRQSLYNTFGDKHGLFLASLQRYRSRSDEALTPLARPDAGLADLAKYMRGVIELQRTMGFGACLLVKTAFGSEGGDVRVRAIVEAGASAVRSAFARVLAASAARGELARAADVDALAAYLYAVQNGLIALLRTGASPSSVDAAIEHTFASLPPVKSRKPKKRSRP